MSDRPARKGPQTHRAQVVHKERLTPHMIRVVFGGEGLAAFATGECTDHYVKLVFPLPDVDYPEPFDIGEVRATMPRAAWPRTRTYTVAGWDPEARRLTIDFVHHGDEGLAGPWADAARPGDELYLLGPGGGYAPEPDADWHLLAGDEAALPAIAAALAALPAGARALAFIEVAGREEEQKLDYPEGPIEVVWLHREGRQVGEALVAAVTSAVFPPGEPQVFVHGEAHTVKALRRHLRHDRQLPRDRMKSVSGYWRRGSDEDGWQSSKAEWNQRIEAEQEAAAG
ncbi:siderophore-interacting protein [Streptomyces sp. 3MP-14]|uniref:Siderophore-interacting protein n=1 Tax=Streptomyces mimosae TaxID=2586635 RepID=A0A5N5ZZV6_9ACTN|nr:MULTISPECIES: siderophore-interacting protein [Streptomyces]KAB8162011.1 siderophore-interacting protein [Streptomyces mimosae]KAB8173709.1 siderophore-interacting protein [Streptomyces sp. 3MP-14]